MGCDLPLHRLQPVRAQEAGGPQGTEENLKALHLQVRIRMLQSYQQDD